MVLITALIYELCTDVKQTCTDVRDPNYDLVTLTSVQMCFYISYLDDGLMKGPPPHLTQQQALSAQDIAQEIEVCTILMYGIQAFLY